MADEYRIAITSNPSLNPDELPRRAFPVVRKGFDPAAVRNLLEMIADELRAFARREEDFRRQIADAERRAASPELDEATLTSALGVETTKVLQAAQEAAREIVTRGEARSDELLAAASTVLAEHTAEAEAAAARITDAATAAGEAASQAAQAEADRLIEATKAECRRRVHEANETRSRVLGDLTQRRKVLRLQVEQLLAGRTSLISALDGVRGAVDGLTERLARAEDEARAAADAAEVETLAEEEAEVVADAESLLEATAIFDIEAEERAVSPVAQAAATDLAEGVAAPRAEVEVEEGVTVLGKVGEAGEAPAAEGVGATAEATIAGGLASSVEADEAAGAAGVPASEDARESPVVEEPSAAAVDELFAKIRASRAEQVARARKLLDTPDPGEHTELAVPEFEDTAEAGGATEAGEGAAGEASGGAGEVDEAEQGEGRSAAEDDKTAALARRDDLLGPVVARLSRSLKRALQDDQNELLDRVRRAATNASLDDLLSHEEQQQRYEAAARAGLEAARQSGISFARAGLNGAASGIAGGPDAGDPGEAQGKGAGKRSAGKGAGRGATARGSGDGATGDDAETEERAHAAARRLSEELVGSLRLRIEGGLAALDVLDAAAADVIGAAYREWKTGRVSEIAGDHATRVFADGQLAALRSAGTGAGPVVWVVDDGGTHCPDCDDNALAGPQSPGEPFPTGQLHPPIHPGCRCLLVPVAT